MNYHAIVFALVITVTSTARAWDAIGHLLVDCVAAERLTPAARQAADELVKQLEFPGRAYDFITAGCWMDDIKTRRKDVPYHGMFKPWHYIDLGVGPLAPAPEFPATVTLEDYQEGDIVRGLNRAVAVLRGGDDPLIKNRAVALAMVLHLTGDIHQPLHGAAWYFTATETDAGGNAVVIANSTRALTPAQKARGYKPHYALHYFWDTAYRAKFKDGQVLIEEAKDYEEPSAAAEAGPHWFDFTARAPDAAAAAQVTDFKAWALEDHALAREKVYGALRFDETHRQTTLSREYVESSRELARRQITLAGWRLAELLNRVLDPEYLKTQKAKPASGGEF
ncbi:MAG: S1/P1 nuclease [Verrucomicrobiales bacterium]|jgi:hypothetical protein|nr:S1/P1 nuclease [Verrucomicrobiales bacterium]